MENQVDSNSPEQEISLLDLLIVLAKHRKLLIGVPILAGILALLYGFFITPVFEAKTTILSPQQQQSSASILLAQSAGFAGAVGGALGLKSRNDLYVAMLRSQTLGLRLIAHFQLERVYEVKSLEQALKQLESHSKIASGKEGLISISVEDTSGKRAADIANAYVNELRQLTKALAIGEAAQRRRLLEGQLLKAKQELADAEVALKQVQQKTGILQLEAQGKATIDALASLRAQIAAKQVQMAAMRNAMTEGNPEYQRARAEVDGLQRQLSELVKGGGDDDVILARSQMPGAGLAYVRKMRDVKYYETLFELIAKQYEVAKLDEVREGDDIQVLDPAIEPEHKAKPKRMLLVALAIAGGLFLAVLLVLAYEAISSLKHSPQQSERLQRLRDIWQGK